MSGRVLRAAGVAGGALVLLSGCGLGGGHPDHRATPPELAASAPPPVGSIEHPRPVACVDGLPPSSGFPGHGRQGGGPGGPDSSSRGYVPWAPPSVTTAPPSSSPPASAARPSHSSAPSSGGATAKDDITVGPLTWQGLRNLADGEQRGRGLQNSGGWHYWIRSLVSADAVVTVTVGAEQRARAGLEFGGEYGAAPAPAVTFHGCPGQPTVFRGAFFIAGDGRACVPLDVRVGDGPTRQVMVSFFEGRCPAPSDTPAQS